MGVSFSFILLMLLYFFSLHVYIYFTSFVIGPFTFPPRPPPLCEARDKNGFLLASVSTTLFGAPLSLPPSPHLHLPALPSRFHTTCYRACHLWLLAHWSLELRMLPRCVRINSRSTCTLSSSSCGSTTLYRSRLCGTGRYPPPTIPMLVT